MLENSTQLMSLNSQKRIQGNELFREPIQDWFFKQRSWLRRIHVLFWLCFMQMPPLLAKTWRIIQNTVRVDFQLFTLFALFWLFCLYYFAVGLLNLQEDERWKPGAWIPVGWIPIYDEKRDSRPCNSFHCASARKMRMFHQCFIEFFDKWEEKTAIPAFDWFR